MKTNFPLYVVDTHSLIWYFLDSPKLSQSAKEAFNQIERGDAKVLIPIIVIAELIFIAEKKRASTDINDLINRIKDTVNWEILTPGMEQMSLLKQTTEISEMHDCLIVCDTLLYNAKLITKDETIRKAGIVEVA